MILSYFQTRISICGLAKLLKKRSVIVVFNPCAMFTDSIPKDLSFVSILVVNEVEIEQLLSKQEDPKKFVEEWLYPIQIFDRSDFIEP
ncbi:hypothetical protein [Dubosiella newyorkensis]|uniref:hypothetical protein n=1 Tax=Dubosiella newyorkensis TaxID=1862672 RepID=UPI003F669C1F